MKLKLIEALKERSRRSRRFRILAMLITAVVGLLAGLLLRGEPGVSPDSLRMRSTAELLRILETS
jgi:hypothetical protein